MDFSDSTASQALLAAALGGLLCLNACKNDDSDDGDDPGAQTQGLTCQDGIDPSPHITKEEPNTPDPGEEAFRAECAQRGGAFEIMIHCGGLASGRGFAYDRTIETRSEHTCRGANTCAGYNCVVCD